MTLYWPADASLIEGRKPRLHVLIVGVGDYPHLLGGAKENPRVAALGAASTTTAFHSALRIAEWFARDYSNPICPLGSIELLLSGSGHNNSQETPIEDPTLTAVEQAQRSWRERCNQNEGNMSLLYFVGHGVSKDWRSLYLLLSDFGDRRENPWNCIDFYGFLDGMKSCKFGTQFYFIDACRNISPDLRMEFLNFSGHSFQDGAPYQKTPPANVSVYYATLPGGKSRGPENGPTFFAQTLLQALNGAVTRENEGGRQVVDNHSLRNAIEFLLPQHQQEFVPKCEADARRVEIHFPRPSETYEDRPLEEALGYATRAFKDYLNKNVVDGVELIYFLSYDVWDGCLLYDGLVHKSIEQSLLDYIRREFLGRDRLRSRFEENQIKGKPGELGAAGECFNKAIELTSGPEPKDAEDLLWYIGDLSKYPSEYKAFDRMLGLVSCLYIPVVADLVPGSLSPGDPRPSGGILMAANRQAYGLRPKGWDEARVMPGLGQDPIDKNIEVAKSITFNLRDNHGKRKVRDFLRCIGGMYSQKARSRSDLRRTMNPSFVKAVARTLKVQEENAQVKRLSAIEEISQFETTSKRLLDRKWPEECLVDFGAVRAKIRDRIQDEQQQKQLFWSYRMGCIWRDLNLEALQLQERPNSADPQKLADLNEGLAAKTPKDIVGVSVSLENYITQQLNTGSGDQSSPSERFQVELVDTLIDDLRECSEGPLQVLLKPFRKLAPIEPYLEGIEQIEGLLASKQIETYLHQIAHSLQVWMLGAWILEQYVPEQNITVRQHVLDKICQYFKDASRNHEIERFADLSEQWKTRGGELIDAVWGLIAAMHDIASPLQSFWDWCREFFTKYFGEKTVAPFEVLPALLDVFHDPRFPFHKSAITNHYAGKNRNWLESIFHLGLSSRIDHALAGALILMREISPDEVESSPRNETAKAPHKEIESLDEKNSGIWKKVTKELEGLSGDPAPERGLVVPAYFAHAIAFSHLANMRWKWTNRHPELKPKTQHPRDTPPGYYFAAIANAFRVRFDCYPLTYLIALLEVLLDPHEEEWMAAMRKDRINPDSVRTSKAPLCPFYVSDIRATTGQRPELVLNLCLWDVQRDKEKKVVCEASDLNNLANHFAKMTHTWTIYEPDEFERLKGDWSPIRERGSGWCEIEHEMTNEYRLTRTIYDLLRMKVNLDKFINSYVSGNELRLAVRFENVETSDHLGEFPVLDGRLLISLEKSHVH
jgi:hypothetical protein